MEFNEEAIKESVKDITFESLVVNAIKIPGVKVNRNEFLAKTFANEGIDLQNIVDYGPIEAGCSEKQLKKLAEKLILTRTSESSMVSFAAGIPGGLAIAATIPADTLQFFGMTLRMAQEIAYLYGSEDLWKNGDVNTEKIQSQLILYCGVMYDIEGSDAGVRLLSSQIARQTLKKLPQKALTKSIWMPIVKQVGKAIAIKITKDTAAKGISKVIPVLGGIISGGITFASMKPMGQRLADVLTEATFDYSNEKAKADLAIVEALARTYLEDETPSSAAQFPSALENRVLPTSTVETAKEDPKEDVFATIEKLARLKDIGAISEEEYEEKKKELLSRI